jgi:hypothetical protein
MRVRCHRIVSPISGEPRAAAPYLTIGREYEVLELLVHPPGDVRIRILDDDAKTPSVWPLGSFEITKANLPSNWAIEVSEDGSIRLSPPAWLKEGFWEEYFDGKADAVTEFRQALSVISGTS